MNHRTTHASHCKIYLRVIVWLRAKVDGFGTRASAASDATARQEGWQVTSTHAGLGRRYRDPRFDSLASCTRCGGYGTRASGDPCQMCHGSGRITLITQTTDPPPGRSA